MAKKISNTQLVHIRMPKDMHRRIQREADQHGQTINAEILGRLVGSFEAKRALDIAERTLAFATTLLGLAEQRFSEEELRSALKEFRVENSPPAKEMIAAAIKRVKGGEKVK
jgi:hypothetical protein